MCDIADLFDTNMRKCVMLKKCKFSLPRMLRLCRSLGKIKNKISVLEVELLLKIKSTEFLGAKIICFLQRKCSTPWNPPPFIKEGG